MFYLDELSDRRREVARDEFDRMIEAVRTGTIFAHSSKAYGKWARTRQGARQEGLTGAALEQAITALAFTNPEYVVFETRA